MNTNEQVYSERYQLLNEAQKEAVNAIYGPVMVIAGPGTGKTEVLSMRIANLLRSEAQVQPQEILCLTYTEEAAFNMRKRLLQIVGQAAHKVTISTFHGFCNNIIQQHTELFSMRNLELISDLERVELMQQLISALPPEHPMHRVGNSLFYDIRPLNGFFNEMKKENWTEAAIREAIDSYLQSLPEREQYRYKVSRGAVKKGDLKQHEIDAEQERMQRTAAAAALFTAYNERMKAMGRYDFSDMILWVIDVFRRNNYLLQHYQERFQYILVDEFQDTNGAQNELLQLLTGYWDEPNIFVVGDDDQSIYEFQGARIRNIADFYNKYKEVIRVIVLTENYRSSQPVLDLATRSISNNRQRLLHAIHDLQLDKSIRASLPRFREAGMPAPEVTEYYNALHEASDIVEQISALQQSGTALDEVAVIYSQHKQADIIIALMERKQLPYSVRKSVNALDLVIPQQVLKIFRYLSEEHKRPFSAEYLLFELLHAPYLGIHPADLAALSLYLNSKEAKEKQIRHWRQLLSHEMILSTMELRSLGNILKAARLLDSWLQQLQVLKLPMLLEKIVYDCGIADWLLQGPEPAWEMQVLQSLFDFVRSTCLPKPNMRPEEFLQVIEQMQSEQIELPVLRVIQQAKGVKFYTAHSAKGLEFEHVFIPGCTADFWEDKRGSKGLKLPDTLTKTTDDTDSDYRTEVARRLFFVAMTRAKKHLHISYSRQKTDGKPQQASVFVDEVSSPETRTYKNISDPALLQDIARILQPVDKVYIALTDRHLVRQQLEQFALSVSALNKFLRCPLQFYYEDVLKTPVAENDSMAFGTAVHYALERIFLDMLRDPDKVFPSLEDVLGYFRYKMKDKELAFTKVQYERRMSKGIEILSDYYQANVQQWSRQVELEKWLQGHIGQVPVKGKIDKIEQLDSFHCRVIDYKTGNPDSSFARENLSAPSEKLPDGGDYWRQMVFYKLLLEQQPFYKLKVTEGVFEYIEKSKKAAGYGHKVIIVPEDERIVQQQISTVYERIQQMDFDTGCGEEDCRWCQFAKANNLVQQGSIKKGRG